MVEPCRSVSQVPFLYLWDLHFPRILQCNPRHIFINCLTRKDIFPCPLSKHFQEILHIIHLQQTWSTTFCKIEMNSLQIDWLPVPVPEMHLVMEILALPFIVLKAFWLIHLLLIWYLQVTLTRLYLLSTVVDIT